MKNVIICKLVYEKCDNHTSVLSSIVPVSSPISIDEDVLKDLLSGTEYVPFEVPSTNINK